MVNENALLALHAFITFACTIFLGAAIYDVIRLVRSRRFNLRKVPGVMSVSRLMLASLSLCTSVLHLDNQLIGLDTGPTILYAVILQTFWLGVSMINYKIIDDLGPILSLQSIRQQSTGVPLPAQRFSSPAIARLIYVIKKICIIFFVACPLFAIPVLLMLSTSDSDTRFHLVTTLYVIDSVAVFFLCGSLGFLFLRSSQTIQASIDRSKLPVEQVILRDRIAKTFRRFSLVR